MKPKSIKSILAVALLAPGALFAATATTTPVGYVTETLRPGQFNLIGLTMHNSPVASGVITASDSDSIASSSFDFTTLLAAGETYILELADGTVQEVVAWTGSELTTPQDISALVVNGTTTFTLRKAATVSSVFGATNTAGLTPSPDGELAAADKILALSPLGFVTIYYFDDGDGNEGWFDASGNPAENFVLSYPDGFFVERAPAVGNISLVVSGEVKKVATSGVLTPGFNYLGSVAPFATGLTLATSGIQNFISQSADGDAETVDNVLLPTDTGSFVTCYYFNDGEGSEGWFTASGDPADELDLTTGFLILSLSGTNKPYKVSVPSTYSSL